MTASREERQKIWGLIKDAHVAMLTSEDGNHLRSRPMVASQENFDDGCLWFFTRDDSPKVDQVQADHKVNVSYASTSESSYVSLAGSAALVKDRAVIDQHWNDKAKAWFPKGKDDPAVAMLKVTIEQAEYWDTTSSKMVTAYEYMKARVTGGTPDVGENKKVDVR